jgi:non-ribosomal peptide synthetase component F
MSQAANPGFDAMALETWPCLSWGGTLYITDNEIRIDPRKLKEWLIKNRITMSFQSTAMAELLLQEEWPDRGVELKTLLTGGDRLKQYLSRKVSLWPL